MIVEHHQSVIREDDSDRFSSSARRDCLSSNKMSCWIYTLKDSLSSCSTGCYLRCSLTIQFSSFVLCLCCSVDQVPSPPGGSSLSSPVTQTVISHRSELKYGQVCCFYVQSGGLWWAQNTATSLVLNTHESNISSYRRNQSTVLGTLFLPLHMQNGKNYHLALAGRSPRFP